jgi:hypothetical protein
VPKGRPRTPGVPLIVTLQGAWSDRLWRIRAVLICAAALAASSVGCGPGSPIRDASTPRSVPCGGTDPGYEQGIEPTAGSRLSTFLSLVQSGANPEIDDPSPDPLGCAYEALCDAARREVSEDVFRETKGAAVSPMLRADTWAGARTGDDDEVVGVDAQYIDGATLDSTISTAWYDVVAGTNTPGPNGGVITGVHSDERWRVHLERGERARWYVCEFERR